MAVATAAVAAGAFSQFIRQWDAAKFNGLGDGPFDRFFNFMHFLLRVQKTGGHRVFQKRIPFAFKFSNLGGGQGLAMMLLFLEGLTFGHEGFILAARTVIGHESVDALADTRSLHLLEDRLAQFVCF